MNLQNWKDLARQHWREFLPKRYAALQEAGILEKSLDEAANQTFLEVSQLEQSGFQPDEAWQMVRENHLLLPPEDQPQSPTAPSMSHEMMKAMASGQRTFPLR